MDKKPVKVGRVVDRRVLSEAELSGRFELFISELTSSSHRAAAIAGGAWVEEALTNALIHALKLEEGARDKLFGSRSFLSNFYAKIELAYALRMMSTAIRDDLHRIRTIRNDFAHFVEQESSSHGFMANKIKTMCLSLDCVRHNNVADPRIAYIQACALLDGAFMMMLNYPGMPVVSRQVIAPAVDVQVKVVAEGLLGMGLQPAFLSAVR